MIPSRIILLSLLTGLASPASGTDKIAFHYDRERSGWNATEMTLTPRSVAGGSFGLIWQSPQLDGFG